MDIKKKRKEKKRKDNSKFVKKLVQKNHKERIIKRSVGPRTRCHRDNLKLFFLSFFLFLFKDPNPRRLFIALSPSLIYWIVNVVKRWECTVYVHGGARVPRFGNFSRGKKVTRRLSHWHNFLVVQRAHAHGNAHRGAQSYLLRVNEDIS